MRDIVGDFAVLRHLPMILCCVVDTTIDVDVAAGAAWEVMRRRARAEAAGRAAGPGDCMPESPRIENSRPALGKGTVRH